MDPLSVIIGFAAGGAAGFAIGWALARRGRGLSALQSQLYEAELTLARERGEIAGRLAAAETARDELRAQLGQAAEAMRLLDEQHRAEVALREQREREEKRVLTELAPVKETLGAMHERVAAMERQRAEQFGQLSEQLNAARLSDEHLRQATESLSRVLNDNSSRGVWGEAQLRRVVEAAGLTRHVDFALQETQSSDDKSGRPDLVVYLPGNKTLAVDSKVPLSAYFEASQIPVSVTGAEAHTRKNLIAQHVKAVRGHIDALSKREYWSALGTSPDFTVCFVPNESMLGVALDADPELLEYAFSRHIALASPVSLWSVLKTIAFTWRQQEMSDEAQKLFSLGSELYARLGTMAGHIGRMRGSIEGSVKHFNELVGALERRVLVTARKFPGLAEDKLGAPDPIELTPVYPSAPEFALEAAAVTGNSASGPAAGNEPEHGSEPTGAEPEQGFDQQVRPKGRGRSGE